MGFGPGEETVIGLQTQMAAGREVALRVVADHRRSLEEELVEVWLKREHVPRDELRAVTKGSVDLLRGLEVYVLHQLKWVPFRI